MNKKYMRLFLIILTILPLLLGVSDGSASAQQEGDCNDDTTKSLNYVTFEDDPLLFTLLLIVSVVAIVLFYAAAIGIVDLFV